MSISPPKPTLLLAPGDMLDRYQLLCPIAEGGMGVCWLGRIKSKHGFEKLVAIKMMKPEYALDPMFQQMFVDEARIAAGIEHPNVAAILDIGDKDGALYLAMEYVDGDALNKLMREIKRRDVTIPIGIAARIIADTCGGLHAAHELADASGHSLNVVHRDVSPQNILINVKGVAKLIDFGIAKARDRTSGDTSLGTIKGKIYYMAPEQAVGSGDLDRRADVFSAGAILYQLLAGGRRAYEAESEVATILLLASGKPPLPLPDTVPAPLVAVIMKAIAHDRADRFATALEMQHALEGAMVRSGVATSNAVVADFLKEHLGHRAEGRRKAIEGALAAIASGVKQPAIAPAPESAAGLSLNTDPAAQTGSGTPGASSISHVSQPQWRPPPSRSMASLAVLIGGPILALSGLVLGVIALRHHGNTPAMGAQTASASTGSTAANDATAASAGGVAFKVDSPPGASGEGNADAPPSASPSVTASVSVATAATAPAATAATPRGRENGVRPRPVPTASGPKKKKAIDDGF